MQSPFNFALRLSLNLCSNKSELAFFVRGFGYAFFVFQGGFIVAEINSIKELHKFIEMHQIMIDSITECSIDCSDPIVKDKLTKTKNQIEGILKKDTEAFYDKLTPDEAVIILLLSYIKEKEMNKDTFDIDILSEAGNWLSAFKRITF